MIGSLLYRLGGLLILGDIALLVWQTARGEADFHLIRVVLGAAAVCLVGGLALSLLSRARSGISVPTCPRCHGSTHPP